MRLNEIENNSEEIKELLIKYFSIEKWSTYTIDNNGYITMPLGNPRLKRSPTDGKLPVKFNEISGMFSCHNKNLNTLEGSPIECNSFSCYNNKLTNLIGSPKKINLDFTGYGNLLTSLDGLPESVGRHISITWNQDLPLLKLLFVQNVKHITLLESPGWDHDDRSDVESILNKYLRQGRTGAIQCAAELTKAGYKGNARL